MTDNGQPEDQDLLARITRDPGVMVGKPVVRGTRLTVEYILGLLAHGATAQEILAEYDGLTASDIRACLLFAQKALESSPPPAAVRTRRS
jgi:uncharacterized protein (DUF433 family)